MSASDGGDEVGSLGALAQLVALINEYGSLPRAIFGLISIYILNGIFSIVNVVAGSVLYVFDIFAGALRFAQVLLVGSFGAIGVDILAVLSGFQQQVAGVVALAGPLAPVVAIGFASVTAYVLFRVLVALLGELPVGSSIVDILGLR